MPMTAMGSETTDQYHVRPILSPLHGNQIDRVCGLMPHRHDFDREDGEPCRDRTYDKLIKSQLLYQLS